MWVGFSKGLLPNSGVPRAPNGAFTTSDLDSGLGHRGSGAFDGLTAELPDAAGDEQEPETTYNPAMLSLDGMIGQ